MKKTGRNEQCPCGSGKKFKKCCLNNPSSISENSINEKNIILPPYDEIDYGKPVVDDLFFKSNEIHDMSAPRLLYSSMLSPEVEKLVSSMSNKIISRGKAERKNIENTDNVHDLIDMMKKNIDSLNHLSLQNKILERKENAIPIIIEELKKPKLSFFC